MMVAVGGVIGLLSSLVVVYVQWRLNKRGETKIYYKIINIPNNGNIRGWGCKRASDHFTFYIPMVYEFMNTSGVSRVVRDLSLELYFGEKYVDEMVQIEYSGEDHDIDYGTDNNAYSFTLPPHSIQKQKCLYLFKIHKSQEQAVRFDTVKVRYYDENDEKKGIMIIDKMSNCWVPELFEPEEEWTLL